MWRTEAVCMKEKYAEQVSYSLISLNSGKTLVRDNTDGYRNWLSSEIGEI